MAENAQDWEYRGEAEDLYGIAVLFKNRFLDGVLRTDRGRLPNPVISFESLNVKVLAGYTVHRNPQGMLDEITFNTQHYTLVDRQRKWKHGEWAKYETMNQIRGSIIQNWKTTILERINACANSSPI